MSWLPTTAWVPYELLALCILLAICVLLLLSVIPEFKAHLRGLHAAMRSIARDMGEDDSD